MDIILSYMPPMWLVITCGIVGLVLYGLFQEGRLKEYHDDFGSAFGLLSIWNKGHSISEGRTNLKSCFQHTILIGQSGFGKTTAFLLKSVFHFAQEPCSLIILDPAKEFYKYTSGLAASVGKNIKVLNFQDSSRSVGYNPLARAWTTTELAMLAELLLAPQARNSKDVFWPTAAARLLVVVWRIQQLLPRTYYNLANSRHVVTLLMSSPKKLDALVIRYADDQLFEEYKAVIKQDQKLLSNIIATTLTALRPWEDEQVASVTAKDDLDLDTFRTNEAVLYVQPNLFASHYNVLYEVFFSQLFHKFLSDLPNDGALPLHLICDEMGVFRVKGLETFLSTARKFKLSIQFAVQSRQQLVEQYEKNQAASILANTYNKVIFANPEPDLARDISERLGKWTFDRDDQKGKGTREVASVSELIHLPEDKAIYIAGSHRPIKIKIKPFYKDWKLTKYSKIPAPEIPAATTGSVPLIDIDAFLKKDSDHE